MTRFAFTLTFAIVVTAWADAQSGAPIASDRARQFQANRALLANLIEHTVELAGAGEELSKAQACHHLLTDLRDAMSAAVTDQNPARVSELGDHIAAVADTALTPNLKTAGVKIKTTSAQYPTLIALHTQATKDLTTLGTSVPMIGTMANSAAVKDTLARLKTAAATLATAVTVAAPVPAPASNN